jgi:uncharacterized protein YyaL (SSP411 family)
VQDSPTPGGNPTAAAALLRLEMLSGRSDYRVVAEKTLRTFSAIVGQFGLYAGSYGLALERLLADPVQVVVVGSGAAAERLEATAMAGFEVGKTVIRIAAHRLTAEGVPPALAEMLLEVPVPADVGAWALVCRNRTCRLPATTAEDLREELEAV